MHRLGSETNTTFILAFEKIIGVSPSHDVVVELRCSVNVLVFLPLGDVHRLVGVCHQSGQNSFYERILG